MHSITKMGIDGHDYEHNVDESGVCKIGWRQGDKDGYYIGGGTGGSTSDYFLTDGNMVLHCDGIMIWETEDADVDLFNCWLELQDEGVEIVARK